ncbi:MAG: hypothetical protein JRI34_12915 [Deltaproteobacteria bacterium]|nr:hypothetical protein [Deltaproteobacteria bacterium]
MEALSFMKLAEIAGQFGLPGLLLALWFMNDRSRAKSLEAYRMDMAKTLDHYQQDMGEIRRMYENNVRLVEAYEPLARDLRDVVIMNTQAMTRALEAIEKNQYCPMVRLKKEAEGIQS